MRKIKASLLAVMAVFLVTFLADRVEAKISCSGRFLNPITDVCWKCVFPISIGGARISMGMQDAGPTAPLLCGCPIPVPPFIRPGIGASYWEPGRIAEIVRQPFCSPAFGGITLGGMSTPPGANSSDLDSGAKEAFYHVHWMVFPLLSMIDALTSTLCVGSNLSSVDYAYMTELDPLWQDDELSFFINPEAALFASLPAQAVCIADCAATTAGFPIDSLFWCAGCNGAIYPMAGTTREHLGGLQTSLLMTQRLAAKLHRMGIAMDSSSRASMCMNIPKPLLPKRQYKTQVGYPIPRPNTSHPFGRTSSFWGYGQEFPVKGENWYHIIWSKNLCCAL